MIFTDPLARASLSVSDFVPTGHVVIASSANAIIAPGFSPQPGIICGIALMQVEAVCTDATGAANGGTFTIKTGANAILIVKVTGKIPSLGDRYVWEFPVPLIDHTPGPNLKMFLGPTMGTWDFSMSGFYFANFMG